MIIIRIDDYTNEQIYVLAEAIHKKRYENNKHLVKNAYVPDNCNIGVIGELFFAREYHLEIDRILELMKHGDNGIDFITKLGTIDVKTFKNAYNLIIEKDKIRADIYVLGRYDQDLKGVSFLGWEYGEKLKNCPVKDFGYGYNNYKPKEELQSMSFFDSLKDHMVSEWM